MQLGIYYSFFVEDKFILIYDRRRILFSKGVIMKNLIKLVALIVCLCVLLIAGCGNSSQDSSSSSEQTSSSQQKEVYIVAAASMTDAIKEIGANYEKEHPDVKLMYSFGSSGALQTQIEQGAPADVFISAAQKQMNALDDKGLIDKSTRKDLLENKVVLIVPKDSNLKLDSFADLATDKVQKIALGEPKAVPVGQYSEEIFKSFNITDAIAPKAVYGSDVRQVLGWVETGEVDCGIVYATDAAISDKVKVLMTAPDDSHKPVIYPVAMVNSSKNPEIAKDFIDFLSQDAQKAILEKYGFNAK